MKQKISFFLLLILGFVHSTVAQDSIQYSGKSVISPSDLYVFESVNNNHSVEQLIQSDSLFKPIGNKIPNFGVSQSAYWLKLKVTNNSSLPTVLLEIAYPTLDKVYLSKVQNNTVLFTDSAGESFPFKVRNNEYKNPVFSLQLAPLETATYYIKVSSGDQIILPITLTTKTLLSAKIETESLFAGIYFGIILVMFLYNIFIYLSIRDKSYLFYVTYIFLVGFTQAVLNGYCFKYIWPELPWLAERAAPLFGALVGTVTIFFVRYFLQTKKFAPRFNFLLTIFAIIYTVSIIFTLLGHIQIGYNLVNVNAGSGSLILLFTGIYIYRKYQNRTALFFTIAWSIFLLSIIIFVLKDTGIIPYNNISVLGLQIGSAIEVTLLSFALADRINILKKEKEISQLEALRTARENERIIREQNITLELKVTERTKELNNTNTELNKTLTSLKETQTQLVESEKMASLGQLTAGIAHEINNPINFVTSNIKPLKRDVNMLMDLIGKMEQIAIQDNPTEHKQKELARLKTEFDFVYLQEEISFLLKGIQEGSTRTAEIVKGLRIFSRVDEDDLKKADLNEGIDSTIIIINNLLNGKIVINKQYGNIPLTECYPGKLNQVFLNLISNAIYAINARFKGESGGEITIKTEAKDQTVSIVISDNGSGMSESTLKKLFEPFFTTKPVGEGTGLGLSISYNTIKKHFGTIDVQSAPNEGTTFTLEIPIIHPNS